MIRPPWLVSRSSALACKWSKSPTWRALNGWGSAIASQNRADFYAEFLFSLPMPKYATGRSMPSDLQSSNVRKLLSIAQTRRSAVGQLRSKGGDRQKVPTGRLQSVDAGTKRQT